MAYKVYFYRNRRGVSAVRTMLRSIPRKHSLKCLDYLQRVKESGIRLPANIVKHLEGGLWEVRPEFGGIEYRFLFFVYSNDKIMVVSAFVKKQQKIHRSEIEKAFRLFDESQGKLKDGRNDQ